jgi:hypothetical protein
MNVFANAAVGAAFLEKMNRARAPSSLRSGPQSAGDVSDVSAGIIGGAYDWLVPIVAIGIIVIAASGER